MCSRRTAFPNNSEIEFCLKQYPYEIQAPGENSRIHQDFKALIGLDPRRYPEWYPVFFNALPVPQTLSVNADTGSLRESILGLSPREVRATFISRIALEAYPK